MAIEIFFTKEICYSKLNKNMSHIETIHLSHVPGNIPLQVALYKDLKNASFLREQLLSGNADFQYAFIDATMVGYSSSGH